MYYPPTHQDEPNKLRGKFANRSSTGFAANISSKEIQVFLVTQPKQSF